MHGSFYSEPNEFEKGFVFLFKVKAFREDFYYLFVNFKPGDARNH
jgi:hypothetical protein